MGGLTARAGAPSPGPSRVAGSKQGGSFGWVGGLGVLGGRREKGGLWGAALARAPGRKGFGDLPGRQCFGAAASAGSACHVPRRRSPKTYFFFLAFLRVAFFFLPAFFLAFFLVAFFFFLEAFFFLVTFFFFLVAFFFFLVAFFFLVVPSSSSWSPSS